MATIFVSYARADGKTAAVELRSQLERAGFDIWRDIEDMQGGQSWKEQLRSTLRSVDAVVVLLTPAAVASRHVEWEWETALTLDKQVIPLLILPCDVPDELRRLHYHNMSSQQEYTLGFAALLRDLYAASASAASPPASPQPGPGSRSISVGGSVDGSTFVTGDGNSINTDRSVTHQSGKYNIKIDKADNMRIGDG